MSTFDQTPKRTQTSERSSWQGTAFIVEALLLLVFLIASSAVFVQMFALASQQGAESVQLARAVAAASDVAERFAANPASVKDAQVVDDLLVTCSDEETTHERGTLHTATIAVYAQDTAGTIGTQRTGDVAAVPTGEPLYSITTSRFESEVQP